jgi:hypothetical protein
MKSMKLCLKLVEDSSTNSLRRRRRLKSYDVSTVQHQCRKMYVPVCMHTVGADDKKTDGMTDFETLMTDYLDHRLD